MKIGEIRRAIERASHTRAWLTGGTSAEFRKQQVGPALAERVAELKALVIAPRFADDIAWRDSEVMHCEATIERWNLAQNDPEAAYKPTCAEGGTRHVFLGRPNCQLCGVPFTH